MKAKEDKFVHLIKFLCNEYPKRKGLEELISTLDEFVIHDLTPDEIKKIDKAKKLENVDEAILRKICKAMYIDQKFKKVIFN